MGDDDVLFTITRDKLDTGLRGFPVGTCVTSTVDPNKGLFYSDRAVDELTDLEPERVIYLLLHGKLPSEENAKSFTADLRARSWVSDAFYTYVKALPSKMDPMAMLASSLLILGSLEGKKDYLEDCLDLIAKIPLVVAACINHSAGWGEKRMSKPELGYMQNFTELLALPEAKPELAEVFRLLNILHYDHGGGNLSAFTGKTVASGLADQYASMAAAILSLGGPLHGGASEEALRMLEDMLQAVGQGLESDRVRAYINKRLEHREVIYGYGHAVLRVEDPRAAILYDFGAKHFPSHPLIRAALALRAEATTILKKQPKIQDPYANVDAVTGAIVSAAGFPYPQYFPVLFGLSRTVGITIQIAYERLEARGGKGTPLVRPKYLYTPRTQGPNHGMGHMVGG